MLFDKLTGQSKVFVNDGIGELFDLLSVRFVILLLQPGQQHFSPGIGASGDMVAAPLNKWHGVFSRGVECDTHRRLFRHMAIETLVANRLGEIWTIHTISFGMTDQT